MTSVRSPIPRIRLDALPLVLSVVLWIWQASSLFVAPVPDALWWFSDETWLLNEAATHIVEGAVRLPIAEGSALFYSKGLLLGVPWISSLLYGVPILVFDPVDLIACGRIVTYLLTGAMLLTIVVALHKHRVPLLVAGMFILLLVGTRSFLIGGHCARPDVLCGLVLLLVTVWMASVSGADFRTRHWVLFGFGIQLLGLTSSIHLLRLLPLQVLVALYFFSRAEHRLRNLLWCTLGALGAIGVLVLSYYAGNGSLTLGPAMQSSDNSDYLLSQIPLLRPFSRSVQVSNLVSRWDTAVDYAPMLLIGLTLTAIVAIAWFATGKRPSRVIGIAFTSTSAFVVSWLWLQPPALVYTMHILPVVTFCAGLLLRNLQVNRIAQIGMYATAVLIFLIGVMDVEMSRARGAALVRSNRSAVDQLVDMARSDVRHPRILAEAPMLSSLQRQSSVRVISDHFTGFRVNDQSLGEVIHGLQPDFVMLWAHEHHDRFNEPFYSTIDSSAELLASVSGVLYDLGYDYFNPTHANMDTFKLYRWPSR